MYVLGSIKQATAFAGSCIGLRNLQPAIYWFKRTSVALHMSKQPVNAQPTATGPMNAGQAQEKEWEEGLLAQCSLCSSSCRRPFI